MSPYIDEYENLATMSEIDRLAGSYNGKMYGIGRPVAINEGLAYRSDWLENLQLKEPSDWESFCEMLYAFTYDDPDGNGVDDTVGLYLDSDAGQWDIMESWFGVPNIWGIDEKGDLIHKSRTEAYLRAYEAFRELYLQGLINTGSKGFVDFRDTVDATEEGLKTSVGGSALNILSQFNWIQTFFVEKKITTQDKWILGLQLHVNAGYGALCYPTRGGGVSEMLAVSTNRIKDEDQLRQVLQFLNDVNSAECSDLITYGWLGEDYQLDGNGLIKRDSTIIQGRPSEDIKRPFTRVDYEGIRTGYVTKENESKIQAEYKDLTTEIFAQMINRLEEENTVILNINYGLQFTPETYRNQGEELDAMLYDAEIQYITGGIDDAGFKAALDAWWEAGGKKMTEEINVLYHAAGY